MGRNGQFGRSGQNKTVERNMKEPIQAKVEEWIQGEANEFLVDDIRRRYNVNPENDAFYKAFQRLCSVGKLVRLRRGWYRKVQEIEPIIWWKQQEEGVLDFKWPVGVDYTEFPFAEAIEICNSDAIVIAGFSNAGKTGMSLNLLKDNITLFGSTTLMVNEYNPSRFARRMEALNNDKILWNENKPKFDLLPVYDNHADHIHSNHFAIVDWLLLADKFWQVRDRIQEMQKALQGNGLLVVVLQKSKSKEFGEGADWGQHLPAVYMTIDSMGKHESRLTLKKVKSSKEGHSNPIGKMYGFQLVNRGTLFQNIREIKPCGYCGSKGYTTKGNCDFCLSRGYVDV